MESPDKLRELAAWYREFADRAGNSAIWDARLRTAEDLEAEADRIERTVNPARLNIETGAKDVGEAKIISLSGVGPSEREWSGPSG